MPAFIEENVFKGPTLRQHKALWGKKAQAVLLVM